MNFFSNTIAYYGESDAWSVLTMRSLAYTLVLVLLLALGTQGAKKTEDPKECEVCVEVLDGVDKLIPSDEKSSKISIEEAVDKYCKGDLSAKHKKMCYYITPIKKSVSQPFSLKLPKKKVGLLLCLNDHYCELP